MDSDHFPISSEFMNGHENVCHMTYVKKNLLQMNKDHIAIPVRATKASAKSLP